MPLAASQLLKDLGLAGFVAAVGLQSGLQAIQTIKESGLSLFMIGVVVHWFLSYFPCSLLVMFCVMTTLQ